MRSFFKWVERNEDARADGMKSWGKALPAIQKAPAKPFVPSPDGVRAFLGALNTQTRVGMRDYCAVTVMVDCGLRLQNTH